MPIAHSYIEKACPPKETFGPSIPPANTRTADRDDSITTSGRDVVSHNESSAWEQVPGGNEYSPRAELIKRVKREQRPVWAQKMSDNQFQYNRRSVPQTREETPTSTSKWTTGNADQSQKSIEQALEPSSGIERPLSALHRGDFWEALANTEGHTILPGSPYPVHKGFTSNNGFSSSYVGAETTNLWGAQDFQYATLPSLSRTESAPKPSVIPNRSRAASHSSLSSSFTYRTPTSKLVHQSNSRDFEAGEEPISWGQNRSPDKFTRRRTFSPQAFGVWQNSSPPRTTPDTSDQYGFDGAHEHSGSSAAHSRHSLNSLPVWQKTNSPVVPSAHLRRPSVSSDASLRQHAPMIGRYEESILRGRMSTLPSRPLDFVAQIGVLGKGQCRPSLKCPPHITVPFPAVFYNYGSHATRSSDGPSPYVGLIDLDILSKQSSAQYTMEKGKDSFGRTSTVGSTRSSDYSTSRSTSVVRSDQRRSHPKKASHPSKKPSNGSYRIPEQGQLQIVIKNPNKTAVKLFLVPYDLTGMQVGQKTFIRQRSYSAGPIIDMPLSSRTNLGTDRPEAAMSHSDDPNDRPILRYLIHLHICCPSEGRFYLYRGVRVVFANRVPDGKEKLRNEVQFPEPRYSAYKPEPEISVPEVDNRVVDPSTAPSLNIRPERAHRRSAPTLDTFWSDSDIRKNGYFSFPSLDGPASPPQRPHQSTGSRKSDTAGHDAGAEQLSPRSSNPLSIKSWRLSSPEAVLPEQDEQPWDQHSCDGLNRENMTEAQRRGSPKPAGGLLSQQFRDWAADRETR